MHTKFSIEGGKRLAGELQVDSSKNAVLPILAASILHRGEIVLNDCAPISDVVNMVHILSQLGCHARWEGAHIAIDTKDAHAWEIPPDLAKEIRSSIFLLGSILSRFGFAKVSYPGGCDIGLRPIDLHIKGLTSLGVKIEEQNGYIVCDGSDMRANIVHIDYPSVGATENIMMAAVRLDGVTKIYNAAKEPEIVDLQNFINSMGGRISGAGTSTIYVEGVKELHDTVYTPISDRIIAGTYLIGAAMTRGTLTLTHCNPEHVYSLITKLREAKCRVDTFPDAVRIDCAQRPITCQSIETLPYPGFATDLQAQMCALQAISDGTCMIIENMFETRYKHVPELVKMGANITIRDRCAIVRGVAKLHPTTVSALDLRGGAALVLAGLATEGTTVVENIRLVDRGYYKFEERLNALGANVRRIDDNTASIE